MVYMFFSNTWLQHTTNNKKYFPVRGIWICVKNVYLITVFFFLPYINCQLVTNMTLIIIS
jgi:hypothetical protein